ncbi:hypothetical protein P4131_31360 [Pseudomonas aeruginosa]|nr:hypothetical protein [Pseudomonas aeruginosa]
MITARTRPAWVSMPRRAAAKQARALLAGGGSNPRGGQVRFGAPIQRRLQGTGPATARAFGQHPAQFGTFEDLRTGAKLAGGLQPLRLVGELARRFAGVEDAAAAKAQVLREARLPLIPQAQAGHGQGHFRQVAAHAPAPAPVARGLLGADGAFLQQHYGNATGGQAIGRADANDAATDDGHVGGGGSCWSLLTDSICGYMANLDGLDCA